MLLQLWTQPWLFFLLLWTQKLLISCAEFAPVARALQCCYFDPSKKMVRPECYKENRKWDWCFSCMSSSCWFMNLQHDHRATNGIRFKGGGDSGDGDQRHPAKAAITDGCHDYNEEMGQLKILVGTFCFCREKDFCNSINKYRSVHNRDSARGQGGGQPTKAEVQPTNGATVRTNKTETLILFILIGIMVLFVAFCCIVLNQTCCVLGLCSN